MTKKRTEIMSPAGDFICLSAALQNGADAIYFGVKGSNMRAGARNFELTDLPIIAEKCHETNAKAYLTLNNIYYDSELQNVNIIANAAHEAGIDAVIAWDFGAIEAARKAGIEVFLSTQASAANAASIESLYRNYGIRRFVLARECTLDTIISIRKSLIERLGENAKEISIEVFGHGAMCVSVSGRCYMSEFISGKSANRGECLQPCRRKYRILETREDGVEFELGENFVLSPKDLCTLPFVEKLFEAGVDSLKIEGRNRNAQYVATATRAYAQARDFWLENSESPTFETEFAKLKETLIDSLSENFNRGFSDGFYMGKPAGDWTSEGNAAKVKKLIAGRILNFYNKACAAEIVIDDNAISVGDKICIEGSKSGYLEFTLESIEVEKSKIQTLKKGEKGAIKVPNKVRPNDRVYLLAKE